MFECLILTPFICQIIFVQCTICVGCAGLSVSGSQPAGLAWLCSVRVLVSTLVLCKAIKPHNANAALARLWLCFVVFLPFFALSQAVLLAFFHCLLGLYTFSWVLRRICEPLRRLYCNCSGTVAIRFIGSPGLSLYCPSIPAWALSYKFCFVFDF